VFDCVALAHSAGVAAPTPKLNVGGAVLEVPSGFRIVPPFEISVACSPAGIVVVSVLVPAS
jgi:hypothetical protein